jgi:hypothetical protein
MFSIYTVSYAWLKQITVNISRILIRFIESAPWWIMLSIHSGFDMGICISYTATKRYFILDGIIIISI